MLVGTKIMRAGTRIVSLCLSFLMLCGLTKHQAQASETTIKTRIGKLKFKSDCPTAETVEKLNDELLFQAATQVHMWSLPLAAVVSVREAHRSLGIKNFGVPIFESFLSPKTIIPTGNQETIYAYNVLTLGDEPVVIDAVPGVLGFIADAWQRPITDVGLTGPDEGKGGKFLLVPPGYKGKLPEKRYFIARSPAKNIWWLLRGFVKDGKTKPAVESLRKVRIYSLSNPGAKQ
jgi:hypothetical protein